MRIWAATGTLAFSLLIACVANGHPDDKRNGNAQIHKDDQRDHHGADLPVYRIDSLCIRCQRLGSLAPRGKVRVVNGGCRDAEGIARERQ
jgi:hypothetical protein